MADKKTPDDKASTPAKKKAAAKKPAAKKTAAKKTPRTGAESPYRDDSVVASEAKDLAPAATKPGSAAATETPIVPRGPEPWTLDTEVKPAMTPSSGHPIDVPSGDLDRLLRGEHAGPHAFLGAHPLASGGIVIRALAPDVMRAVVV